MGVYEVTQAQYKAVTGKNPSHFSKDGIGKDSVKDLNTDDFPVERVPWQDTQTFLNTLNDLPELKKMGLKFRLPTEAEWEYSCRGGANEKDSKPFYLKHGPTSSLFAGQINFNRNLGRTSAVGSFPESVNSFGLYDMHGNVCEWCEDYYDSSFYTRSPKRDPLCDKEHPENKNRRALRGGSWNFFGVNCRAANRFWLVAGNSFDDLGFRVACVRTRNP